MSQRPAHVLRRGEQSPGSLAGQEPACHYRQPEESTCKSSISQAREWLKLTTSPVHLSQGNPPPALPRGNPLALDMRPCVSTFTLSLEEYPHDSTWRSRQSLPQLVRPRANHPSGLRPGHPRSLQSLLGKPGHRAAPVLGIPGDIPSSC